MTHVAVNARRPVSASLVQAQLPRTENGGCLYLSGDLRQVFCIIKICHTVAFILTVFQFLQCCCSDFMSSSCVGDVGSSQEGVGRSRRCNVSLHQCLYPTTSSQPVAERLQDGHLHVEPIKHHYHFIYTILLWLLPLNVLCQDKQWLFQCDDICLARIHMFYSILHHIHGCRIIATVRVGTVKEQGKQGGMDDGSS